MTVVTLAPRRADPARAGLLKYDGRAPRYTSYPTAVQFTPQIGAEQHRAWLAALPPDDPVSLYVHVPLCRRLCWYCGCNTRAVNGRKPVADYVDLLVREIGYTAMGLPGRLPATSLHFGGGTPNLLAPEDLTALSTALRQAFDFAPEMEVAAEIDPAELTEDWVKAAAELGLSRASVGVQDLSPKVQAAVNRPEPFEIVERAVGWLRAAGVRSINLDLMYGLPEQGVPEILETLDALLALRPERIALFGYAHVPWMKGHQKLIDETRLPGPAERLAQEQAAAERLVEAGYVRIGLDHFALPQDGMAVAHAGGRLRRNFQGYTTDGVETLVGFGASAISRFPQGFLQNHAQELAWRTAVAKSESAVSRGVELTDDDRFRGEIIERLMCDLSVDLGEVCRRHGRAYAELTSPIQALAPFFDDGLVGLDAGRLRVREAGRTVVRSIAVAFDAYAAQAADRHSKAL